MLACEVPFGYQCGSVMASGDAVKQTAFHQLTDAVGVQKTTK